MGVNEFGFDLYSKVASDKNTFISPYSVWSAIAMVAEGAKGKTAEELDNVLHCPSDFVQTILDPSEGVTLNTANAFWVQNDLPVFATYVNKVRRNYGGEVVNVDFRGNSDEERQRINAWVEEKTNQKIQDLLPPGSVNASTGSVITNAVYFKGNWEKQFDKTRTQDDDFFLADGRTSTAKYMRNELDLCKYGEDNDFLVLELPYKGDDISMTVFLPRERGSALESSLTAARYKSLRQETDFSKVEVYLPKFTFTDEMSLRTPLQKLGVKEAFGGSADFSGITGRKNLSISDVLHKTFVDVNEEGTEAAGATGVIMMLAGMPKPSPIFRADHPFLFTIQDRRSDTLLFLGKVVKP